MNMSTNLAVIEPKPRSDVIDDLRGLLEHAQSGRLRAFAITALYTNGEFTEGFCGVEEAGLVSMIGSVTVLLHRLLRKIQMPADEGCGE